LEESAQYVSTSVVSLLTIRQLGLLSAFGDQGKNWHARIWHFG